MKFNSDNRTYYRSLQHNQQQQQVYAMGLPHQGQPMPIPQPVMHPAVPVQQLPPVPIQNSQDEQPKSGQLAVKKTHPVYLVKNACVVKRVHELQVGLSNGNYLRGDKHDIPDEAILVAKLSKIHVESDTNEQSSNSGSSVDDKQVVSIDNGVSSHSDEACGSDVSDDGDNAQLKSSHMSDSSQDSGCGMSDTSSGDNLDSSFSGEEDHQESVHSNRQHHLGNHVMYTNFNQTQNYYPNTSFIHNNGENYGYAQVVHNNNVNRFYHQTISCPRDYETRPNNISTTHGNPPIFSTNNCKANNQYGENVSADKHSQEPNENRPVVEMRPIPKRFRQLLDEEARNNPVMYPGRFEGQALIRHKPLGNRKRKLARMAEMARLMDQTHQHTFVFNPEAEEFEPQLLQDDAESSSQAGSETVAEIDECCAEQKNDARKNSVCTESDSVVELEKIKSDIKSSQTVEDSIKDDCQNLTAVENCDEDKTSADLDKKSSVDSHINNTVSTNEASSLETDSQHKNESKEVVICAVQNSKENVQNEYSASNHQPAQVIIQNQMPRYENYQTSESCTSTVYYTNPQFTVPPPPFPYVRANDNQAFVPPCAPAYAPMYVNAVPSSHPAGCPPPVMQPVCAPVAMVPGIPAPQMPLPPQGQPMGTVYYPVYAPPPQPQVMQAPAQPYPGVPYQQQY